MSRKVDFHTVRDIMNAGGELVPSRFWDDREILMYKGRPVAVGPKGGSIMDFKLVEPTSSHARGVSGARIHDAFRRRAQDIVDASWEARAGQPLTPSQKAAVRLSKLSKVRRSR